VNGGRGKKKRVGCSLFTHNVAARKEVTFNQKKKKNRPWPSRGKGVSSPAGPPKEARASRKGKRKGKKGEFVEGNSPCFFGKTGKKKKKGKKSTSCRYKKKKETFSLGRNAPP